MQALLYNLCMYFFAGLSLTGHGAAFWEVLLLLFLVAYFGSSVFLFLSAVSSVLEAGNAMAGTCIKRKFLRTVLHVIWQLGNMTSNCQLQVCLYQYFYYSVDLSSIHQIFQYTSSGSCTQIPSTGPTSHFVEYNLRHILIRAPIMSTNFLSAISSRI